MAALTFDQLKALPLSERDKYVGDYKLRSDGFFEKARSAAEAAHDVRKTFKRLFRRDVSLSECGKEAPLAQYFPPHFQIPATFDDCIMFETCRASHVGMLQPLFSISSTVGCPDIPLAHGHVLWNCQLLINLVEDEENGRQIEFSLEHQGAHLGQRMFSETDAPVGRGPPMIALLIVEVGGQGQIMHGHSMNGDNFVFNQRLPWAQMQKSPNPAMMLITRILVPRAYFDLAKIIDLNARPPTVSDQTARVVGAILRGERQPGHTIDFVVEDYCKSDGEMVWRHFFMDPVVMTAVSDVLKTERYSDGSIHTRCDFDARDMPVLVPLFYGAPVSLPGDGGVPTLIKAMRQVFNENHLKTVLAPQWERLICKRALTLDPKQVTTFASVYRLLTIIWSFPRGWMPVAKRVAIGVIADTVHLNAGDDVDAFIDRRKEEIPGEDLEHWDAIKTSMIKHLFMVSSVRKTGLKKAPVNEEATEEDSEVDDDPVEILAGGDTQKKVDHVIKMESGAGAVIDEEEWDDEARVPTPVCKCTIS